MSTTCPGRRGRPCGEPKAEFARWCIDCTADWPSRSPSAAAESPSPPSVPPASDDPAVGLTATYAKALERIGKAETPEGVLILHMASMLEFGYSETLSAKASMSRALMSAWTALTGGAVVEEDALDEISKKRREKFGA